MDLPPTTTLHNIMVFIEYLHQNLISHKVICSYVSSIKSMAVLYNLPSQNFSHPDVNKLLRSISLTFHFSTTPRGLFDIPTLYNISISCDSTDDPHPTWPYSWLPYIAPLHNSKKFSKQHHFLRQDVIFGPPRGTSSSEID